MGIATIDLSVNSITRTFRLKSMNLDLTMSPDITMIFTVDELHQEYTIQVPFEPLLVAGQLDAIYQALQASITNI